MGELVENSFNASGSMSIPKPGDWGFQYIHSPFGLQESQAVSDGIFGAVVFYKNVGEIIYRVMVLCWR